MFNAQSQNPLCSSITQSQIDTNPRKISHLNSSKVMYTTISQRLCSRIKVSYSLNSHSFHRMFWGYSGTPNIFEKFPFIDIKSDSFSSIKSHPERNFINFSEFGQFSCKNDRIKPDFNVKRFASVAEAAVSSSSSNDVTDLDDEIDSENEVKKLLNEMGKQEKQQAVRGWWRSKREKTGSSWNYLKLKRRQTKIETEAWEQAAKEYKELLSDMCEQKLAPNLPYMKSLFLGWFEPLCKKISQEQELCRQVKHKAAYAPYFDLLPADKMAVITMHRIMGLIMTGGENGCARVVAASCSVGEAIEQEVCVSSYLLFNWQNFVFSRVGFAIQKGVAVQLVGLLLVYLPLVCNCIFLFIYI